MAASKIENGARRFLSVTITHAKSADSGEVDCKPII